MTGTSTPAQRTAASSNVRERGVAYEWRNTQCVCVCVRSVPLIQSLLGPIRVPSYFCVGSLESGKKEVIFSGHRHGIEGVVGHTGHVLALAVTSDGKYLVS